MVHPQTVYTNLNLFDMGTSIGAQGVENSCTISQNLDSGSYRVILL
jgi:hypothetical protein